MNSAMAINPRDYPMDGPTDPPQNVVPMPPYRPPAAMPSQTAPSTPHSVGSEKSAVSALLLSPERIRDCGLTAEHFHLPQTRIVFRHIRDMDLAGTPVDPSLLIQRLLDHGDMDRIGGPATVAELMTYDPTGGLHLSAHVSVLADKLARRAAIEAARNIIDSAHHDTSDIGDLLDLVSDTAGRIKHIHETTSMSLLERAYALAFNPSAPPPKEENLMSIAGAPIASNGNLTGVQGKSKVGKSSVMSAIIGAALRGNCSFNKSLLEKGVGDCLGFEWSSKKDTGRVIHFDTEQSPSDWFGIAMRATMRGAIPSAVPRLLSIPLVRFSRRERVEIVRQVLKREKETNGIAIAVIDGVADLCASPNDEPEALELVATLMALCHEHDTAMYCVLHENPGTDAGKTRGHLGSELNRKAFANLRIDKEDNMSVIYGEQMRKKDIPRSAGLCFQWSDDAKMHVSIGTAKQIKAQEIEAQKEEKNAKTKETVAEVFGNDQSLDYSTLVARIMDAEDVLNRSAKSRVRAWKSAKLIAQTGNGTYVRNHGI